MEKKFITNQAHEQDGFGFNYQIMVYSLFYAEKNNLDFKYLPMTTIEHNYDSDPNYIEKLEKMIQIRENFPNITDLDNCLDNILDGFKAISFFEKNIEHFLHSQTLKIVKELFYKQNLNPFKKNNMFYKKNIAIHIRRMNKHDGNRTGGDLTKVLEGMSVPNEVYIDIITQLNIIYPDSLFHIYSQGDINKFINNFQKNRPWENSIIFHLDEPIVETFTEMVFADILVTAPSSLSYMAGILSNGIIYYIPFCNPSLPNWNIIQNYTSIRSRHEFLIPVTQYVKVYYDAINETFEYAQK
jgi:hypothetical protein